MLGETNTHGTMIVCKLIINIHENICVGVDQNDVGVPGRIWSRWSKYIPRGHGAGGGRRLDGKKTLSAFSVPSPTCPCTSICMLP